MPTDSNGNYSLPDGYLAVTGETILPSQHNPPLEDIAAGLTARVMRNGSAPMTGNLVMGNHKITGLTPGTATTDAATFGQTSFLKKLPELVKTDNYTITTDDIGSALVANKATAIAFALPAVAGALAAVYWLRNIGVGDLTIDPNASEQIDGAASLVLKQGDAAIVWANGTLWRAFISRRKATQAEAEAGTATDVWLDPARYRQAATSFVLPMIGLAPPVQMVVAVTSDTAVDIDATQVTLTNGSIVYVAKAVNLTVSITTAGVNGLDTGSEAANTTYHAYVIFNPITSTVAGLLSTSPTAPTLPTDYTFYRRVGAVRNNASSNLYRTRQRGDVAQFVYGTNPASGLSVVSGNNAGSNIPVINTQFAPATATAFMGVLTGDGSTTGSQAEVGDNTSFKVAQFFSGSTENKTVRIPFTIYPTGTTIYYRSISAAGSGVEAVGWIDAI